MAVIKGSSYKAPPFLRNNHLQTILPTLFRQVKGINYIRERIDTPDGDFIDLDFSSCGFGKTVLLSHGLEGSSDRAYMKGMARAFNRRGWDAVAFNFRGCSGEVNRTSATYHSGKTEDMMTVINYLTGNKNYKEIVLVGFSLGANLTLKFAGETGRDIPREVKCAVGISAPCDLNSSAVELAKKKNALYSWRFLRTLVAKMKEKENLHPENITRDYGAIRSLKDFDDSFTAPLNGFRDAEDYWTSCSSLHYIEHTAIPTLIISAKDDPILSEKCFPYDKAGKNGNLFLEVTEHGGHMGFITFGNNGEFWHETRVTEFVQNHI